MRRVLILLFVMLGSPLHAQQHWPGQEDHTCSCGLSESCKILCGSGPSGGIGSRLGTGGLGTDMASPKLVE